MGKIRITFKKSVTMILLAVILLSSSSFTIYAEEAGKNTSTSGTSSSGPIKDKIDVSDKKAIILADTGAKAPNGNPGDKIRLELPLVVNREYIPSLNYIVRNITIEPMIPTERSEIENWPFEIRNASYIKQINSMTYNSRADVFYDFQISKTAKKGIYPVQFLVNGTIWRKDEINGTQIKEDVEFILTTYVTIGDDGSESKMTNEFGALSIATIDKDGAIIPAPAGDAGQRIKLKLPIVNNGGSLTDINISPVISNSLDEWPFVVEVVNYGKRLSNMEKGDIVTLDYDFKISDQITSGAKPINFRATYKENGMAGESLFSAYINVVKGKAEEVEKEELPDSVPKLMVVNYKTNPEEIYSGQAFSLTMEFKNTSRTKTINNCLVSLTLTEEELMPDNGKSDSVYIDSLGPGKSVSRTFYLKALPTMTNPTSTVVVNMNYETSKVTLGTQVQGVVLEIKQEVALDLEYPTIYGDDNRVNEPIAVTIPIINKGKSKLFNLQVYLDDENISMMEKYYGGDLLPGAKLSADFQILPHKIGNLDSKFLISYDDIDGVEHMEELAFNLDVIEGDLLGAQIVEEEVKAKPKFPRGLKIFLLLLILVGLAGGGYYYYRKRKMVDHEDK